MTSYGSCSEIIAAGWKDISLVDVRDSVSFTLWVCGCNLKCPFCHNWRIADLDRGVCRHIKIESILGALSTARSLIDYIHVTGGEPLTQWRSVLALFRGSKEVVGVKTSLNSNLTLYKPLYNLLRRGIVDHVATDVKAPPDIMYGLPRRVSDTLWTLFIRSLRLVSNYGIPIELRIPIMRNMGPSPSKALKYIREALKAVDKGRYYVVIQPLLGPPLTEPRDQVWCSLFCNPSLALLEGIAETIKREGADKVYVNAKGVPSRL